MRRLLPLPLPLLLTLSGCNFPQVDLVPVPASSLGGDTHPPSRQVGADLEVSVRYLDWSYVGLEFRVEVTNRGRTSVLIAPEDLQCILRSSGRAPRSARPLDPRRRENYLMAAGVLKKHTLFPGEFLAGTVTFDLTTLEDARYQTIQVILPLGSDLFAFDFERMAGPAAQR